MAENTRTDLQSQIESFLLNCQARRLAAGTIDFYRAKLRVFLAYLKEQGIETAETITPQHIRAYLGGSGGAFWQRDYYEHIIRDEADLERIRAYIIANPRLWNKDQLQPGHPSSW